MRNIKYLKGLLVPYNPAATTETTAQNIKRAVDNVELFEARRAFKKWEKGIITLNFVSKVCGGTQDISNFIRTLDRFTKLEGVAELRLEGTITLIMDGEPDPMMFRVNVREGTVTYQQASYGWADEMVISQ
jgi:uncharacterized protein with von Willebrand factor type A (vWA) domain